MITNPFYLFIIFPLVLSGIFVTIFRHQIDRWYDRYAEKRGLDPSLTKEERNV